MEKTVVKKTILLLASVFLLNNQLKPMEEGSSSSSSAAAAAETGWRFSWGLSERQGKRSTMEDVISLSSLKSIHAPGDRGFFAVYDGHGGKKAAEYAAKNLHHKLAENINQERNVEESLIRAFEQTDQEIQSKIRQDGTTAVAAYIDGNRLYLSWVGDARAIVVRNGKVILATQDHKPDTPEELTRIINAGASVVRYAYNVEEIEKTTDSRIQVRYHQQTQNIKGGYADRIFMGRFPTVNMSRSLGDKLTKTLVGSAVIATPEIISTPIQVGDIIILTCDGVWEKLENEDATRIVQQTYKDKQPIESTVSPSEQEENAGNNDLAQLAAKNLRNEAYNRGSEDNISALVVRIDQLETPTEVVTPVEEPVETEKKE